MSDQSAAADTAVAGADVPEYTKVRLSRTVPVHGFDYKPGVEHTVDAATLAALGDAVIPPTSGA